MARHHRGFGKALTAGILALSLCHVAANAMAGQARSNDPAMLAGSGGGADALGFDGLEAGAPQGFGKPNGSLNLSLGAVLEGLTPDMEFDTRSSTRAAPAQKAESGPVEGSWRLVPMLPKRDPENEMTLLQSLTPMGFGFIHSF